MSIQYFIDPLEEVVHVLDFQRLWEETIQNLYDELDTKTAIIVDAFRLLFEVPLPACRSCDVIKKTDFDSWISEETNTHEFTVHCLIRVRAGFKKPQDIPKQEAWKIFERVFVSQIRDSAKGIFQKWIWLIIWKCYLENLFDFASLVSDLKSARTIMQENGELGRSAQRQWEQYLENFDRAPNDVISWTSLTSNCRGNWDCTWYLQPSARLRIGSDKIIDVTCFDETLCLCDTSVSTGPIHVPFKYVDSGNVKRVFEKRIATMVVASMDILCKDLAQTVIEYIVVIPEIWDFLHVSEDSNMSPVVMLSASSWTPGL